MELLIKDVGVILMEKREVSDMMLLMDGKISGEKLLNFHSLVKL
ncbi:MAG: hypothetical protein QNJ74_18700 [Trichodesmium sp. MO_231.B1]|nr:hypothetical protein [Trichodesmium sp. MO_231.B1]